MAKNIMSPFLATMNDNKPSSNLNTHIGHGSLAADTTLRITSGRWTDLRRHGNANKCVVKAVQRTRVGFVTNITWLVPGIIYGLGLDEQLLTV